MLVRVRAVAPPRGQGGAGLVWGARASGGGGGGGPLTQLRAVPQQGRVAAPAACLRSHSTHQRTVSDTPTNKKTLVAADATLAPAACASTCPEALSGELSAAGAVRALNCGGAEHAPKITRQMHRCSEVLPPTISAYHPVAEEARSKCTVGQTSRPPAKATVAASSHAQLYFLRVRRTTATSHFPRGPVTWADVITRNTITLSTSARAEYNARQTLYAGYRINYSFATETNTYSFPYGVGR
ncbi:unnamed protein product, partial [Iphiclides podalirius]